MNEKARKYSWLLSHPDQVGPLSFGDSQKGGGGRDTRTPLGASWTQQQLPPEGSVTDCQSSRLKRSGQTHQGKEIILSSFLSPQTSKCPFYLTSPHTPLGKQKKIREEIHYPADPWIHQIHPSARLYPPPLPHHQGGGLPAPAKCEPLLRAQD